MNATQYPFGKIHYFFRKADYTRWQRLQSKQHILRSQLGFTNTPASRPKPCQGCTHYHGLAYGYRQDSRTVLVCGLYPYGWQDSDHCPDWCGKP